MLLQTVLAGALSVPFFLRDQITSLVRRLRQRDEPGEQACELAGDDEADRTA